MREFILFILCLWLVIICAIRLMNDNRPSKKGCKNNKRKKHKWVLINDERSKSSPYIGSVSLWQEYECEICGKKEKTDKGVW